MARAARRAWVLNLDADLELGAARGYTPKRSVLEAMGPFVARLVSPASGLLGPDDVVVDASTPPGAARGLVGRAFCPTPRALALLRRAGAEPEAHPSVEVLRRVNSRAFASALGATLPGAAFVTALDAALAHLEAPCAVSDAWRVKRAFGMTGRGQRVVAARAVTEADRAFVRAGVAEGGVQIEPNVAIVEEYAIHVRIEADGARRTGRLVRQRCDARGAWLATERVDEASDPSDPNDPNEVSDPSDPSTSIARRLVEEAERVAGALFEAGYFGPFGVDAYTYRDPAGALCLQPRSEINARYTMGFGIGLSGA
jgi:hypothetical protein